MLKSEPSLIAGSTITRSRMITIGGVLLVVGLTLLGLSAASLFPIEVRLPLSVAGAVVAYLGLDRLVWGIRRQRGDVLVWLAATWLIVLSTAAFLAPVLPLGEASDVSAAMLDPTYVPPFESLAHPLGTNGYGLDMLARVLYGARSSLTISLLAVALGLLIGGTIGLIAGMFRGLTDTVVGVFTNALLAVPPLILLIVLSTVLDPGVRNVALALAVLTIPTMVRLARANTIAYAQREFVLAAKAMGAPRRRLMLRELAPNVLPPMSSMAVLVISGLIVAEAALSFLGLGIRPPAPTWGNMIAEVRSGDTMTEHPFVLMVPGAFLFLTVFSFNLLGEKAQQRWDPRKAKL